MKSYRTILASAMVMLSIASCAHKEEAIPQKGRDILFGVDGSLEGFQTKSVIDSASLSSATVKAYIEMNGSALNGGSPYTLAILPTGYWKPTQNLEWESAAYRFQAYAYTPASAFSNIGTDGLSFTVIEPANNDDPEAMADYLISDLKEVTQAQSNSHPVIGLTFSHVLPTIQVYVTKAHVITSVSVTNVTLSGLYYGAGMTYNSKQESWIPAYSTERTGSYRLLGEHAVADDRKTTDAVMNIITVPQGLAENTTLTIRYRINESMDGGSPVYNEYEDTFSLSQYITSVKWGHRTVFHAHIDSGIHLTATIAPWKHADSIEGTVLPEIK